MVASALVVRRRRSQPGSALADIAAWAVLDRHQDAGRRDIRVDTGLSAAPATGDPALAESLVANLVSNAIRHNVDGGRVEVSTAITHGRAVVTAWPSPAPSSPFTAPS